MPPRDLARLTEDQLRAFHRNCLLNLDCPDRGDEAAALLPGIHAEYARRAQAAAPEDFLPMLDCVGYNVRWHGLGIVERHRLLDWLLVGDLPRINDAPYMASWGEPGSPARWQCLRENIRIYRHRYGNGPGMENAAARWDADLAYLDAHEP